MNFNNRNNRTTTLKRQTARWYKNPEPLTTPKRIITTGPSTAYSSECLSSSQCLRAENCLDRIEANLNEMLGWLGAPLDPPTDTDDSVKECSIDGRRTLATIDEMLEDIHNHGFTDLDFSEAAVVANTPNDKRPLQATNSSQLSEASNVSRAVEAEDICKYDSESGGPVLKLGEPLEPLPSEWSESIVTVEPLRIRKKKLKTVGASDIELP